MSDTNYKIPDTYGDWLTCFESLKKGTRVEYEYFTHIHKGKVPSDLTLQKIFEQQLIDTINVMLNNRIKKFNKELNFLLSFNETLEVVRLFYRLNQSFSDCLFFHELTPLNTSFKVELHQSIETEVKRFWQFTLNQLHKESVQVGNHELEAIVFEVKKIKLLSTHLNRSNNGGL